MNMKLIKLENSEKYQRLLSKDIDTHRIKSGHILLKPGEEVGKHTTDNNEEVLIILKGTGEAIIEKEIIKIEAHSVLYIPPKTIHNIKNDGNDILEYIYITSNVKDN